jgi:DNA-binding IclR family transcriptional regulator
MTKLLELDEGTEPGTRKYVGAVENAVAILRFLAHTHAPAGVAHIARETGINLSTTFNILRTLTKEGLASFDTRSKEYRLGMGILEISMPLIGLNQVDIIRPSLEELSQKHRALIGLWKITPQDRIVLVDRLVKGNVVHVDMMLGSRLPSLVGAVGRCIAASRDLPKAELRRKFQELRWENAPSFDVYARDVAEARTTGIAFDRGNLFRGLDIAASLILDHGGQARFGVSGIAVAGQVSDRELEALAQELQQAAAKIAKALYGRHHAG